MSDEPLFDAHVRTTRDRLVEYLARNGMSTCIAEAEFIADRAMEAREWERTPQGVGRMRDGLWVYVEEITNGSGT